MAVCDRARLTRRTRYATDRKKRVLKAIDVAQKLAAFDEYWVPHVIAQLNSQAVKLVKFQGEFVWHSHDTEDELFFVLDGSFRMEIREGSTEYHVTLERGEMIVIPRGVEHRPVAKNEVAVMLFEPLTTVNTGDADDERRVTSLPRL